MNQKLKWISSGGGPYILAAKNSAHAWLGTEGLSAGDKSRHVDDYERACEGTSYVNVIAGSSHEILVVTEPDEIACFSRASDDILLVKWIGADSDEQVRKAIQFLNFELFETLPVSFSISEPEMFLFDSAWQLADIGENYLKPTFEPGCYSLSVLIYRPNDDLWLDIIRLKKITSLNP